MSGAWGFVWMYVLPTLTMSVTQCVTFVNLMECRYGRRQTVRMCAIFLLLTNALAAANEIIIPMQAQPFSVVGMSQLTSSIANVQRKINPGLRVKGILLTMTEHTNVSDHYCGQVRSTYGNKIHVFTTEIPRNVKVQESQANAEPTILYDPKSNSAKAYIEFAKEVSGYGREEQVYERDEDARDR